MPPGYASLPLALALSLAATTVGIAGETQSAAPPARPALVVAVSVDQFSADLYAQHRRHFTGGLARLSEGAVFPSGYQSHAATETCPGHSTILTGTRPARNGIIANSWLDPASPRKDKEVYCAEDERDPRSSARDPIVSAVHLKSPTLGTHLKRANPQSRNVAVAGKDRSAVMMGGHDLDAAYWWKRSMFATFDGKPLSQAAQKANRIAADEIAKGASAMPVPAWCSARERPVAVGNNTIGTNRFAMPAATPEAYGSSPRLDRATVDLAIALVDEQQLGRDSAPDVLSVGLSGTDVIGHRYGHEGAEMCIQLAELDMALGRLFAALDRRGIDYAVVLTADHGGIDATERLHQHGYPQASRLKDMPSAKAVSEEVTRQTGLTAGDEPLFLGGTGDFIINARVTGVDRQRAAAAAAAFLGKHPQVEAVFTHADLASEPISGGSPQDWTLKQRVRASFDPARSADVQVMFRRAVNPLPVAAPIVATHGSPWDYDRRVPILFWRKRIAAMEQPAPVETVDIAPTLAALLGLGLSQGTFDGRCLDIDAGSGDICPR